MNHPLRLLILDDRPDDAQQMLDELRQAGLVIDWRRVETETDFLSHLTADLDLILAEHALPDFGAARALELLRERGLDVPLIVVARPNGEEQAVAALQQGAADFLRKGRLGRLGPAVAQALERRQARRARRQHEERYRGLVETLIEGVWAIDAECYTTYVNRRMAEMLGYTVEEMVGRHVYHFIYPEHQALAEVKLQERRRGLAERHDFKFRRKDGAALWTHLSANPIFHDDRYVGSHAVVQEIPEQRRQEELRLAAFVDSSEDAIVGLTPDGRVTSWNPGAERLCGHAAAATVGQPLTALVPLEHLAEFQQRLAQLQRGERVPPFETALAHQNGGRVEVSLSLAPLRDRDGRALGASAVARDLTEHKRLEEQFRHAQKLDAVGRLAGGVAHDFNNLLTVINGFGELLLASMPPGGSTHDLIQQIAHAGNRAAVLTRQLLAFSRKQPTVPRVLDLKALVADTEKLLRRLIGEDIELVTVTDQQVWPVKADPGQLEQVLVNLVVNARDAMPRMGKVTLETRNVELDEGYIRGHPGASPGPHVLLAVSDTGVGMDEATRARLFEPFFTTKGDKGTGLGLATVYGIVKGCGGHIEVESAPGQGAAFRVYLPRTEERFAARKSSPGQTVVLPRGTETVLIVEDDETVRALVRHVLKGCGYQLLEASNGQEALRLGEQHAEKIDLLLTDVVMPQVSGPELAERLTALRPKLKVLFLSGYTAEAVGRHGVTAAEVQFLEKPFTPSTLALKIREVLDAV